MTDTIQPKRVLRLIARLNVGGPARHVAWLMEEMDPAAYAQTLAAGRVQDGEDDLGPELAADGLRWVDLPRLGRAISPLADLASLLAVLGLLTKTRPHILATHASKAGLLGRTAALLYRPYARLRGWPRLKVVHTFHGHTFHSYFGPAKARVFLGLERFLARRATWRIVTISPLQHHEIVEVFQVGRPGQAVVVPLGIDLAPFADPAPGRARFRAELGAGEDELLIGAVGRIAPVKNFALFFAAAAALRGRAPELFARCRFLLIGGGSEAELAELQGEMDRLGLGGRASLLGVRSDREAFFPGLDALMVTSNNEGTPVSILEGGACGLPVAATEVGGVPDLLGGEREDWGQGAKLRQRGVTAPVGDAAALARGLERLLAEPETAARLGRALRGYVEDNHAKQRLAADITRLYDQARD
ncbi:MAG: glycosyltransferase [Desulfarculaceae bacterium]|nr:glycosyltransferase [Desulfarculaceae bacterium]MCF8074232.1 glycosyltransferase [Desulfarculaceae bacterium]MCF8103009.1 glycosyltransferase [Desulfarculaceae bacterium]MCF8117140.1 glycosyltransferase [Desulfarculaceae bacterium]